MPYRIRLVAASIDVVLVYDSLLMREKMALLEVNLEMVKFGRANQINVGMPNLGPPYVRPCIEVLKGISAGRSQNTYRGLVSAHRKASNARNFTQCDSLLIGQDCGAHTVPYIESKNASAQFEHEATTSKISDDQMFYCLQRGLSEEEAVALIVNGFVKDVIQQLPMEFAVEAQRLLSVSLEGSVG